MSLDDITPNADIAKAEEDLGKFVRQFSGIFALAQFGAKVGGMQNAAREAEQRKEQADREAMLAQDELTEIQVKLEETRTNLQVAGQKVTEAVMTAKTEAKRITDKADADAKAIVADALGVAQNTLDQADAKADAATAEKRAELTRLTDECAAKETDRERIAGEVKAAQASLDALKAERASILEKFGA